MHRSLVIGVNGQDGSYLAEALLARGHEVIGVGSKADSTYVKTSGPFATCRQTCEIRNSLRRWWRGKARPGLSLCCNPWSVGFRLRGFVA